jgi:hypothetical protein
MAKAMYQQLLGLRVASDTEVTDRLKGLLSESPSPVRDLNSPQAGINATYAHFERNRNATELLQLLPTKGRAAYEALLDKKLSSTAPVWR